MTRTGVNPGARKSRMEGRQGPPAVTRRFPPVEPMHALLNAALGNEFSEFVHVSGHVGGVAGAGRGFVHGSEESWSTPVGGLMDGRMDGRMHGMMDGLMDGLMDGCEMYGSVGGGNGPRKRCWEDGLAERNSAFHKVRRVVSGETVSRETVSGETVSGETVSGETVSRETVSRETVSGETVVSGETPCRRETPVLAETGSSRDGSTPVLMETWYAEEELEEMSGEAGEKASESSMRMDLSFLTSVGEAETSDVNKDGGTETMAEKEKRDAADEDNIIVLERKNEQLRAMLGLCESMFKLIQNS